MEYRVNPNAVYVEVCDEYLLVAVGEARGKLPQLRPLLVREKLRPEELSPENRRNQR